MRVIVDKDNPACFAFGFETTANPTERSESRNAVIEGHLKLKCECNCRARIERIMRAGNRNMNPPQFVSANNNLEINPRARTFKSNNTNSRFVGESVGNRIHSTRDLSGIGVICAQHHWSACRRYEAFKRSIQIFERAVKFKMVGFDVGDYQCFMVD